MEQISANFKLEWPSFNLDLDIRLPGSGVTAIFGPSGSGKTTLLRCIAGLERAKCGLLSFKGEVWQDEKTFLPVHRRPLGYVFQEASLFPHLTVMANLRYGLKRNRDAQTISLEQAVELLGIGHLLDRKPERLSGGERQRVGIARALATQPRLLLLDEPFGALDAFTREQMQTLLLRLWHEHRRQVLLITHDIEEAIFMATDLVLLSPSPGRVTERLTLDFGRRFAAGEPCRSIKSDPAFIERREYVLERVFAEREAFA